MPIINLPTDPHAISIFSGTSNKRLTSDICKNLALEPGKIFHHTFPSGEKYCQFKDNIRGRDVFLVQSPTSKNTNSAFMELLIMIDAAKRASAHRITAVLPMSFYTRQDRKDKSRVPISSRLCFDLLEKSGVNRILTMDLHADQIAGFTNLPFDHLLFNPILINYIKSNTENDLSTRQFPNDICLMAPDAGALKRVEKYADILKCEFGFISKRRINDDTVKLQSIIGNVTNKDVFLIDDLTESFGTLSQAATACKEKGAKSVKCAITHPCLTKTGIERLKNSINNGIVDKFIYGDTLCNKYLDLMNINTIYKDKIDKLTVSTLFARAIYNIHTNNSISSLF